MKTEKEFVTEAIEALQNAIAELDYYHTGTDPSYTTGLFYSLEKSLLARKRELECIE